MYIYITTIGYITGDTRSLHHGSYNSCYRMLLPKGRCNLTDRGIPQQTPLEWTVLNICAQRGALGGCVCVCGCVTDTMVGPLSKAIM